MKNTFLITAVLVAISFINVFAQGNTASGNDFAVSNHIRGGVIFGMNASQIDGDDFAGYHKVGFNTGFYGQLPLSKRFFISTEILYSQEGANNPVNPTTPVRDYFKWNLQYAQIPVLIHFQDKKAFNVGAGFSYSRLVGEHLYAGGEPQPPVSFCTGKPPGSNLIDPKFLCLKRSDYCVVAEANYLPFQHFAINVRYAYSMAPMGYYGNSNFINRSMHNNLLSFRLMYIFGT